MNQRISVKIRRIDKTLPLPEYKTSGAVAFDLSARETTVLEAQKIGYVPLNVCVATPPGYMLQLAARSSLHKRGVMLGNGLVYGDQDFSGNGDEYRAVLFNFTSEAVTLEKGDRILQGVFLPIVKVDWEEKDDLETADRGGIGSTGIK